MIAVDWGTSSLRAARLGPSGDVLEERAFGRGILTVPAGGFPGVFDECFGDWMRSESLCLIAGMAGSRQGWVEAPYCECPAGAADLAARLAWVVPGRIGIVPGMSCESAGVPDVMRGEETQVFGALALTNASHGTFVLPGTHSKWVRVENGRVLEFATYMTGEFFALLRQHSILARSLPDGDPGWAADAFDAGVRHSMAGAGLLHAAFGVRTLTLFERLPPGERSSFLSGVVIGEELRSRVLRPDPSVTLIGAPALTQRYARALGALCVPTSELGDAASWRGLHGIARTITPKP